MTEDIRTADGAREPIPERQGVREPQRLERGIERERPERKVGDRIPGEGSGERRTDEPAEGTPEPQEPRSTHVDD